MTDSIVEILFLISWSLLYPTMILLLLGLLYAFVLLGGFLSESHSRQRCASPFRDHLNSLRCSADERLNTKIDSATPALVTRGIRQSATGLDKEKCLGDLEIVARRALARLTIGIRVGPILGLAGTLIPLGPALMALSAGDTETLSQKLVVAFSTSVVGLFISGLCYVMHSFRKSWYSQDLLDIQYLFGV